MKESSLKLKPGSVCATFRQMVKKRQVGHSCSSMFPHLHFQLMNSIDMESANGLPCAFEKYEVFKNDRCQKIYNAIPGAKDRIRFNG